MPKRKYSKEYEVQGIVDKRTRKGATEYLIKWKGFSKKFNSWIPKEDCNCEKKIRIFEKKLKKKQQSYRRKAKKASKVKKTKQVKDEEEEYEMNEGDDEDDFEYESGSEDDFEYESGSEDEKDYNFEDDLYTCDESTSSSVGFEPEMTRTRNKELFNFNENELKGKKAHKIVGATLKNKDIWFLVELKNENTDFQMVPASYAKQNWPDIVFKYYESCLDWE